MMEQRANEGYIITDSIHVGDVEFVIGENETQYGTMFVTWRCSNGTDYYWGHYFNDLFAAQKDLVARAQEEVKYLELKTLPPEQRKLPKKKRRSVNDDGTDVFPFGEKFSTVRCCVPMCFRSIRPAMAALWSARWRQNQSSLRRRYNAPFCEAGYYCFEEDCAATVALRELMDKGLFTAPVNYYWKPGEYEKCINECVQRYYPEYWQARKASLADMGAPADPPAKKRKGA